MSDHREPGERDSRIEQFREIATEVVEKTFDEFDEPDDDYVADFVTLDSDGGVVVAVVGPMLVSEEAKDALAQVVMPKLIKENNAVAYAFCTSAWRCETTSDEWKEWREANPDTSLEHAPNASEMMWLWIADWTGEYLALSAPIMRAAHRPPLLGSWRVESEGIWDNAKQMESAIDGRFEGRMVFYPMAAIMGKTVITQDDMERLKDSEYGERLTELIIEAHEELGYSQEEVESILESGDEEAIERMKIEVQQHMLEHKPEMFEIAREMFQEYFGPPPPADN